ncbi:hypothetical protein EDD11_007413 [Mortierella claussenii]|nr:hypothetical protein EDD11_007413 [Mortierella claussenii]
MLLIKSLLLLGTATLALASYDANKAIVSGARFVGVDTTAKGADAVEIFRNPENHASAVGSVLVYAAKSVDYNPRDERGNIDEKNTETFGPFERKVSTFPGFATKSQNQVSLSLSGDNKQFQDVINEYYETDASGNKPGEAFAALLPKKLDNVKQWLLTLLTIRKPKDSDSVEFELASMELTLSSKNDGKVVIDKQQAKLTQSAFVAIQPVFIHNAERFANFVAVHSVSDVLDRLSSNEGSQKEALQAWFEGLESDDEEDMKSDNEDKETCHHTGRQHLYRFSQLRMGW